MSKELQTKTEIALNAIKSLGYVLADPAQYIKEMSYEEYLKTPHWQQMRRLAKHHAEKKCQTCGKIETVNKSSNIIPEFKINCLEVHHNNYENLGKEKLSDLVVLCSKCHDAFHKMGCFEKEKDNG